MESDWMDGMHWDGIVGVVTVRMTVRIRVMNGMG
jgi:hypothetical protein